MSYPGSKGGAGVAETIIGQMPAHPVYVEGFAGSAVIFRRKRPALQSILIELDPAVSARLDAEGLDCDVRLIRGDALEWLPKLTLPAAALVYLDPPYLLETRQGRLYYDHEFSTDQHRRLLAMVAALQCSVMISGYPSPLYGAALHGWRCLSYRTRTRGKTVTECLWMNYPEPDDLHDWRFAGRNFRERLTLKRLATRWLARLQAMPPRKRNFLLHTLRNSLPHDNPTL